MTMERMQSPSGREEMEQEVDTLAHMSIQDQMQAKAEEGAKIAQRLQNEDLSQEERDDLGKELDRIIEEGSRLKSEKERIEARYQ